MSDGSGLHPRRVVARRSAHRASVLARSEPLSFFAQQRDAVDEPRDVAPRADSMLGSDWLRFRWRSGWLWWVTGGYVCRGRTLRAPRSCWN